MFGYRICFRWFCALLSYDFVSLLISLNRMPSSDIVSSFGSPMALYCFPILLQLSLIDANQLLSPERMFSNDILKLVYYLPITLQGA